eukprot:TRINITY_DN4833_c0_g1_i7.p1 TRINITY_DN4833_c0_g1~~TRINITY_DN4833_c0_g1_i7.p1  ORF type:complete len:466 (+),score=134.51 TRINITY_DN4833_c0_g1_i7:66-1463(+)
MCIRDRYQRRVHGNSVSFDSRIFKRPMYRSQNLLGAVLRLSAKNIRRGIHHKNVLEQARQARPLLYLGANKGFATQPPRGSKEDMSKLKDDAMNFLKTEVLKDEGNDWEVEIKSHQDWVTYVTQSKVPVVLDCYAQWCGPCKKLTPILQEKARQAGGAWRLVKLDIDANGDLAGALKIQSVPTVYLIHGGNAYDGFIGFPEPAVMDKFFGTLNKIVATYEDEKKAQRLWTAAEKFVEEKKYDQAMDLLLEILKEEKFIDKYGAQAAALGGYISLLQGKKEHAEQALNELRTKFADDAANPMVKKYTDLILEELERASKESNQNPEIKRLQDAIEKDPKNLDQRFQLANLLIENNLFEQAVDALLDIIKINRNWEGGKAKSALLQLFEKLGSANKLVIEGRKKLQKVLYQESRPERTRLCMYPMYLDETLKRYVAIKTPLCIFKTCLLYTSPSPRDGLLSRMPSSA